jgi:DNA topoisomerase-1
MKYIIRIRNKDDSHTYILNNGSTPTKNDIEYAKSLVIPPAYPLSVIFCKNNNQQLLSLSYDDKGRKQYKYRPEIIKKNTQLKFEKLTDTISNIQNIKNKTTNDINYPNTDITTKESAIIIKIILESYLRIGSDNGVKNYEHFGISTILKKHINFTKSGSNNILKIKFIGKKGVTNSTTIKDNIVIEYVQNIYDRLLHPDDTVFQNATPITVNNYLKDINPNITAKTIRTYGANEVLLKEMKKIKIDDIPNSERGKKILMNKCIDKVSEKLQNTRNVLKKNYIIPKLLDDFMSDTEKFLESLSKKTVPIFMKDLL